MNANWRRKSGSLLGGLLAVFLALAAKAAEIAIVPDGTLEDWPPVALRDDPNGDAHLDRRDLVEAAAATSSGHLFLRFRFDRETPADEVEGLWLVIDGDADASTGDREGAELRFDLGGREGTLFEGEPPRPVQHGELGLLLAPTVTSRDWELRLPRVGEVFRGPRMRWRLHDVHAGDRLPDRGWIDASWSDAPEVVPPIPVERHPRADLRLVAWNVEHDGLFPRSGRSQDAPGEAERRGRAQARLLRALVPDVLVVCESWQHSGTQLLARIAELTGTSTSGWQTGPMVQGTVVLSRWPIERSWEVLPVEDGDQRRRRRVVASLVRVPQRPPLLVVANHWRCCDAEERRQEEADALIAFLRDAWTPGGRIDLPAGAGVVAAGDFNLVGEARPLRTLLRGDVVDEDRFGPDRGPDADGSSLTATSARHLGANLVHTWARPSGRYYPGRLDWIVYSDATLEELRSFVADTRTMTEAQLREAGWTADDTPLSSDHAPVVADLRWWAP